MRDTTPEIEEKIHAMIRMKSPVERFKMGCSMYETSKRLVIRAILENNPGITQAEFRKELFLRFYGNDFHPAEREEIAKHFLAGY